MLLNITGYIYENLKLLKLPALLFKFALQYKHHIVFLRLPLSLQVQLCHYYRAADPRPAVDL